MNAKAFKWEKPVGARRMIEAATPSSLYGLEDSRVLISNTGANPDSRFRRIK